MRVEAVSVITSACVALWLAVGCLPLLTPAQAQAFSHSGIHADEEPPLPDVVALIGQRRSEITAVFPGRDRMFFSWRRWDRLHLVFSRDGQFVGVRLYRNAGITEQQADAALRQLGVTMEPNKYFAGAAERGYSDMSGPIRTVIYGVDGGRVTSLIIASRLADDD